MRRISENVAGLGAQGVAADVGGVAGRGEERYQVVAEVDRVTDRHVVEVARGLPRIVGDQHVAGRQRVDRIGG